MDTSFSDAALLLIGHGSTANEDSAEPVYQHAAELQKRGVFARVAEAFWKQEPTLRKSLNGLKESRVFMVPLFISEGYFTQEAIPNELGLSPARDRSAAVEQRQGQTLIYCRPIGTHDLMTNIIMARAREVTMRFPFPRSPAPLQTALFIAGHGTGRNENSRRAIDRQVELIRAQSLYAEVHAVFIEDKPSIGECYSLTQARNLIVVPFFMSDGLHVAEDIPVLLGEAERIVRERLKNGQPTWRNPTEKRGKLVWYGRAVGTEPQIADIILERVREASKD